MAAAWTSVPETSAVWRHGGFVLYGLGSVAVVAAAVYTVGPVGRLGSLAPLCRLGVLSYAVYLLHWPVLWVLDRQTEWPPSARFVVASAVSIGLAELSLRLVETPVRRTGRVAGAPALVAVPLVALVALVGGAVVTRSAPAPTIDYAAAAASMAEAEPAPGTSVVVPAAGAPTGAGAPTDAVAAPGATIDGAALATERLRVSFFGDSTALMTAAGLKAATLDDPRLQTQRGDPQLGCGLLIADRVRDGQGTVGVLAEKCTRWPQAWPARLDIDRTEVAVVQTGPWETFDLGFDDVDGWRHLGDPVVDERATVLLHQAIDLLSSRGAHVVLVTTSHVDEDVRGGPGPCSCPERLDRWNELLRAAAAARPDARVGHRPPGLAPVPRPGGGRPAAARRHALQRGHGDRGR